MFINYAKIIIEIIYPKLLSRIKVVKIDGRCDIMHDGLIVVLYIVTDSVANLIGSIN